MTQRSQQISRIKRLAKETFGFEDLRPGQEEAIRAVAGGRDTLVVMPTGWGKSAIYQLAALMVPGPTVVVSPLIALQKDQMEAIESQGAGGAAVVNSTLKAGEREEAFENLEEETVEFLFLAPEQFSNAEVLERLKATPPSIFVVDEAHCISEWGHDFRPDYLRLGSIIEMLGHPIILALTATAAPPVRAEISERLGMRDPLVVVQGFDRPNIWLGARTFTDEATKRKALLELVETAQKPGLVYVATRKHAEALAKALAARSINARYYHAGMKAEEREATQLAFMQDEIEVIVATIAFGMGIDKPNVRFVFHYDIPGSLDAYYQHIGRAGRDGEPAVAMLLYNPKDLGLQRFLAGGGHVDIDQAAQLTRSLQAHDGPVAIEKLQKGTGLSASKLDTLLNLLAEIGAVELLPTGEAQATGSTSADAVQLAEEAAQAAKTHHQFEQSRLDMMRNYAETSSCRRNFLLGYFGEQSLEYCHYCDKCESRAVVLSPAQQQPFPVNSRVVHSLWGPGLVMRYEADKMTVLFDKAGYKTLGVDLVLAGNLLTLPTKQLENGSSAAGQAVETSG